MECRTPAFVVELTRICCREELTVYEYCLRNDHRFLRVRNYAELKSIDEPVVPVGTVDFCEAVFGKTITPNYFPEFTRPLWRRKLWRTDHTPDVKCFVKPTDKYKRFSGSAFDPIIEADLGPIWCSEMLDLSNYVEVRCYVANGEIVKNSGYKYLDKNELTGQDVFDVSDLYELIEIPDNWCGTVDLAIDFFDKTYTLIECHHPFAVGWYGDSAKDFVTFLIEGNSFVKNI